MTAKRAVFLIQSVWELLRFLALFAVLVVGFSAALLADRQAVLGLVLLGSSQLVLPAGLVFLFLDPGRFAPLASLIRLGKVLEVFSEVLLLAAQPFDGGLQRLALPFIPDRFSGLAILLTITLIDLVFLFLLFSFGPAAIRSRAEGQEGQVPLPTAQADEKSSLPDYSETVVPPHPEDKP